MRWLSQTAVVTLLNLRTIPRRLGPSVVALVGIAGVVGVFVALLSMAEGFRATMANTGAADTAIVMRAGADTEMTSVLTGEDVRPLGDVPDAPAPYLSTVLVPARRSHRGGSL